MLMLGPKDITGLRENLGMTRKEFADYLVKNGVEVSEATLSRWENGHTHPPFKKMQRLNELGTAKPKPLGREQSRTGACVNLRTL